MKKSLCELVEREGRREVLAKNNPNGRCSEGSACQCTAVGRSDALFSAELHYED